MTMRSCMIKQKEKEEMQRRGEQFQQEEIEERKRLINIYQEKLYQMIDTFGDEILKESEMSNQFSSICKKLGIDFMEIIEMKRKDNEIEKKKRKRKK